MPSFHNKSRSTSYTRRRVLLFIVLLLGALLIRLVFIKITPIHIDELKIIQEILNIRWDALPVQFQGYGMGEYIVLASLAWPFIKLMHTDPLFTIRGIVLVSNLAFITILFFLVRKIFNQSVAWTSVIFAVIWPWSILAGSFGSGIYLMPFLGSAALLLLLYYMDHRKPFLSYLAFFLLSVTFYAYPGSLFWVPVLLIALVIAYRRRIITQHTIASFIMMLVLATPLLLFYLKNQFGLFGIERFLIFDIPYLSQSRFDEVSVFNAPQSGSSLVYYIANYLTHYYFVLLHSDLLTGKISFMYIAFIWDSLFIYSGVYFLIKKWRQYKFIMVWFLLYPVGTSLTVIDGGISFSRDIMALPLLLMLSAYGATALAHNIKKYVDRVKKKIPLSI